MFETWWQEIESIWKGVVSFNFSSFNWFVLVFPVLMVVFVVIFFLWYRDDTQPRSGTLEWIGELDRPRFSLSGAVGRMVARDWAVLGILTVLYGAISFFSIGDAKAPQTFWQATPETPSMTLDLGQDTQIDTVMYYTGLWHGDWTLELSANGSDWREQPKMLQRSSDLFKWKYATLESEKNSPTRYLRISSKKPPMELGELAVVVRNAQGERKLIDADLMRSTYPAYANLWDEQWMIPLEPSQLNGAIFDEIYHARTAYEYLRGVYPYETTHPPLGKAIISVGIRLFGMTPFGWRFMGVVFGILMVPLIYIFIKWIFKNTSIAACGTALFAFESMHFTQTRLATIDTYGVFFTILMYMFMYRFISTDYEAPFGKAWLPLALSGLFFGLGAACKWTGIYAAAGLVVLYIIYLVSRGIHQVSTGQKKNYIHFLLLTLGSSILFFVCIPLVIYTVSYLPYVTSQGLEVNARNLIDAMWKNQVGMLDYHGKSVLGATHDYASRWWMWVLDIRPILYYSNYPGASRTIIAAFTNPLLTIGGLVAICACWTGLVIRKSREGLFIVIGYLAQLVPWMIVSRLTFEYHYFPSMIFLTLAMCYVFHGIWTRRPEHRWRIYLFTGLAMFIFLLLAPPMAGITVPNWYSSTFIRWLPSWPF